MTPHQNDREDWTEHSIGEDVAVPYDYRLDGMRDLITRLNLVKRGQIDDR